MSAGLRAGRLADISAWIAWLTGSPLGKKRGKQFPDQPVCIVQLDTTIALLAAELHRQYKLAMADTIVCAAAQKHGAELLTCDAQFRGLPGAVLHSKSERI